MRTRLLATFLLACACGSPPKPGTLPASVPAPFALPTASSAPPGPDPEPEASQPDTLQKPLDYMRDGSLVAAGRRSILTRAPNGQVRRFLFGQPPREAPRSSTDRTIWMTLPDDVRPSDVTDIDIVANGDRINVTHRETEALLYDAHSGALLGPGLPVARGSGMLAGHSDVGFSFDGDAVSRVDLRTGKAEPRVTLRCKPDHVRAPVAAPSGEVLLVMCDNDAIVLEGTKLTERRRVRNLATRCDDDADGWFQGDVLPDGHTLLFATCGCDAELDLATGADVCVECHNTADQHVTRTPHGRAHAPRCVPKATAAGDYVEPFFASRRYRVRSKEPLLGRYGGRISIEDGTHTVQVPDGVLDVVLAPDEATIAYVQGHKIIVRALPEGAVVGEYEMRVGVL